jgi:hypothetical protein
MNSSSNIKDFVRPDITMVRTVDVIAECIAELMPIYQNAFAGPLWGELTMCEAPEGFADACLRRRSEDPINATCAKCGEMLRRPCHSPVAIRERWINRFREAESRFYLERLEDGTCLLAALAWKGTPATVAAASFSNPSEIHLHDWLDQKLPREFVWLEEMFAHQVLRNEGNLWNFDEMVRELLKELDSGDFVFRTKNPALINKTEKMFPTETSVLPAPGDERKIVIVRISS